MKSSRRLHRLRRLRRLLLHCTSRHRPPEDAIADEEHRLLGFFGGTLPGLSLKRQRKFGDILPKNYFSVAEKVPNQWKIDENRTFQKFNMDFKNPGLQLGF